jgi:hypothetical protein
MPTRVLDLTSLPSRQDMAGDPHNWRQLFKDRSCKLRPMTPGTTGRYVALSYCWGKSLAYTTTSGKLAAHQQDGGIAFAQLPKTLQDALLLTRYLGLDFIWADCLCIIQDDKADWEQEAARMAGVYSNAYLTVAATRAAHCGEGFLQARKVGAGDLVHFEDILGAFDLYFVYDDCTISPGSMESVTPQPLRVQRVRQQLHIAQFIVAYSSSERAAARSSLVLSRASPRSSYATSGDRSNVLGMRPVLRA